MNSGIEFSVIIYTLCKLLCSEKESLPVHSFCSGVETKIAKLYTSYMADAIHSAIQREALSQRAAAAIVSVPKIRE